MNLQGSIDLMKLELAGIATINGKKCVVIPIEENNINVRLEGYAPKSAYLGLSVYERREVGRFGDTHNVKQRFSKDFVEAMPKEVLSQKPYLGNMKTFDFPQTTSDAQRIGNTITVDTPMDIEALPF